MGELLLVCSLVTLILLVLFINKKKQEERQFYAELQNRKNKEQNQNQPRRYSRDDSMVNNRRSPLPGDSSFQQRDRYRGLYSPAYDKDRYSRNYDHFNTSNHQQKSFLTPTGLNDTYEKYEREKRHLRNLKRSDDKDLQTEKFPMNTSNAKGNQAIIYGNDYSKFNGANMSQRQSLNLTKSQSFPSYNLNGFPNAPVGVTNLNMNMNNNFGQANAHQDNNQPGYKVIKLEDFLSNENLINSTSPMFKNQPKITLDDVNPSLIKYLHKNDENYYNQFPVNNNFITSGTNFNNNVSAPYQPIRADPVALKPQDNQINNNVIRDHSPFKPLSAQNLKDIPRDSIKVGLDSAFYEDIIPKKIDFSKVDTISQKKKDENLASSRILALTPTAKKDESLKFESFGDHQNQTYNDESLRNMKSA